MRRVVACLVLAVALTGCGDGSPSKRGTSAEYADSWNELAAERCGGVSRFATCGFRVGARDDDLSAIQASNGNFVIYYDGAEDDLELNGWKVAIAYSERHNCYRKGLSPEEPLHRSLWGRGIRCAD